MCDIPQRRLPTNSGVFCGVDSRIVRCAAGVALDAVGGQATPHFSSTVKKSEQKDSALQRTLFMSCTGVPLTRFTQTERHFCPRKIWAALMGWKGLERPAFEKALDVIPMPF